MFVVKHATVDDSVVEAMPHFNKTLLKVVNIKLLTPCLQVGFIVVVL